MFKSVESKLVLQSSSIRKQVLTLAYNTRSGHIGSALSCIEILTVLYFNFLKIFPKSPKDDRRDRFILSKGHAACALYVVLSERGFFPKKLLQEYLQDGSFLAAHPTPKIPGIEFSAGALGHGLSVGVGMALASKKDQKPYRVIVLLSDGECDEGSTWEAAMSAGQFKLDNLIVMVDYNKLQALGKTKDIMDLEPFLEKWKAFGFDSKEVNGHDTSELLRELKRTTLQKNKPQVIIAHTIKGYGISFLENKIESHYCVLTEDQFEKAMKEL